MLKIAKVIALILCLTLASVFAQENEVAELKFLQEQIDQNESMEQPEQTIDEEPQTFEVPEETYLQTYEESKVRDIDPVAAEQFVLGYLDGVELFKDVVNNSTCLSNADVVVKDAIKLYNILKDLHIDTEIISHVKEIIQATQEIVSHLKNESAECKAAADLAMVDIKRIAERVSRDGYVKELASHTWNNIGALEEIVKLAFENYRNKNMREAGRHFGRATKFVGFWDL